MRARLGIVLGAVLLSLIWVGGAWVYVQQRQDASAAHLISQETERAAARAAGIGADIQRHFESVYAPDFDAKGNVFGFYGLTTDITERHRIERIQSEFISVVSHELRTPVTSIRGALGLLEAGICGDLPDKAHDLVKIAHRNSQRLVGLVNDILDMDKLMEGKMSCGNSRNTPKPAPTVVPLGPPDCASLPSPGDPLARAGFLLINSPALPHPMEFIQSINALFQASLAGLANLLAIAPADLLLYFKAFIMGLVEGFTEFLPISSTGHLILAASLLDFTGDKIKVFEIAIQAGAMMAVCWEYRARIAGVLRGLGSDPRARKFTLNLVIAFIPAAILGFLFNKTITAALFAPVPVALAFILGGFVILWVERRHAANPLAARVETVDDMSYLDAFKVGCAQAFALIPGTSRSGATIIGGMLFGLSRKAATEFSFFLAIPTLLAATVYSLYKERALLSMADVPLFSVGTVAAFASAFLCVRWLLRYISTHDFSIFAWYRIVFGTVVLLTAYFGVVEWTH